MAVQAQYHPSNVLLFNKRNGQDTKNMLTINNSNNNNYPLPSQPPPTGGGASGGFLIDQSHHLLIPTNANNNTNGVAAVAQKNSTNPRKRGRDITSATTTTSIHHHTPNPWSSSSLQQNQHPHHQLIELSRLQQQQQQQQQTQSPNAVVSTGLKLSFGGDHNHHQIQQQQQQQQMQQNHHSNQYSLPSPVLIPLFSSSDQLVNQINHQSNDLNQLIHAHVQQLHRTVSKNRQRHYQTLLTAANDSLTQQLREKEIQLEKASRRHAELESRAAQLSADAQLWQAKARANEAQAVALQTQLHQAMMLAAGTSKPHVTDNDGLDGTAAEDAESAYIDPERVVRATTTPSLSCKTCGLRAATVVILPCRHLCVCVECDDGGIVQACPVCLGMRNSSVEVFLT